MGIRTTIGNWIVRLLALEAIPTLLPDPEPVRVNDSLLDEAMDWVRAGSRVDPETLIAMRLAPDDARLLAEAFSGSDGRKRLMIFARMTVLRPAIDVSLPADHQHTYAVFRQGQDTMFAALVHYLDVHSANQRKSSDDRYRPATDERFAGADPYDPDGTVAVS